MLSLVSDGTSFRKLGQANTKTLEDLLKTFETHPCSPHSAQWRWKARVENGRTQVESRF